jgi:hypothetical protein
MVFTKSGRSALALLPCCVGALSLDFMNDREQGYSTDSSLGVEALRHKPITEVG